MREVTAMLSPKGKVGVGQTHRGKLTQAKGAPIPRERAHGDFEKQRIHCIQEHQRGAEKIKDGDNEKIYKPP